MSRRQDRQQEKELFRPLVLLLHRQNPSWTVPDIADFFEQSDNPPNLNRHALVNKIHYILARGTVCERKRSGRPRTTTTASYRNLVLKKIQNQNKASVRNVSAKLKKLVGNRHHLQRTQKLTYDNEVQRVKCAKKLRRNFGVTKRSSKWIWDKIINMDFSGKFTLESHSNPHNEGIWATRFEEILSTSRERPTRKFASGIVFWGGISYEGLILKNGPIDVILWLKKQPTDKKKRIYINGHLYAKCIKEFAHPEIQKVCGRGLTSQDDADSKQRTKIVLRTVDKLFNDQILPEEGDAKFADIWPAENIWGILKEKVQGEQFSSFEQLKKRLNEEWKKITFDDCKKLIDKIPNRLGEVIKNGGEQIQDS
ncbi:unnamed protein product [Rotaria sp. Silwood1]|nr:unnamed protein product [Rotaria sp. Silwood1]CAF1637399.1 unnamed protein product [Rotaria sp. Silwood1]